MTDPTNLSANGRLLLGVVVGAAIAVAVALLISSRFFPLSTSGTDARAGRSAFEAHCSGCHAAEPGLGNRMGPTLASIGSQAAERREGYDAVEYLVESIAQPDAWRQPGASGHMPAGTLAGVPEARARNLLAYLMGRGNDQPDYEALLSADLSELTASSPDEQPVDMSTLEQGWYLFDEKYGCSACHQVFGEPGGSWLAPDLSNAHQMSDEYLRESIRHPSKVIVPGYQRATVSTADGTVHEGRLLSETEDDVVILVTGVEGHRDAMRLVRQEVLEIERSSRSLMPPYSLSPDEETALLKILKFLRGQVS